MRLIPLAALLLAGAAAAAAPLSPRMAEAFRKQYPNTRIVESEVAVGDLNKDGLPDFATFVGDANAHDDLPIAVFLAKADGSYALHTESGLVMGHSRSQRALEVQKQSLFLHRSGSNGCCSDWAEKFHFQLRDGVFVLIGEDISSLPKGESDDEDQTSVNYLTREAMFWRKLDGRRKERRLSFKMPALMALKTFSYDTHYNAMPKELHGHFDDQLRFVEGK
jgi:hypothetical protein